MAGISNIVYSTVAASATLVVTLPSGYGAGDHVLIVMGNGITSNPDAGDFLNDWALVQAANKQVVFIRVYDRIMDGDEGSTVTIPMNVSGLHKAWAMTLDDIDQSTVQKNVFTEVKPRIYYPNTIDSGDTAEKLWLEMGVNLAADVLTRTAINNDAWDGDDQNSGTVPGFAYAWVVDTDQTKVGSGDFAVWEHGGAFDQTAVIVLVWDTVVTPGTAVSTGTLATEAGVIAGGQTIILTLTDDTWVATIGADNAFTTALIAGLDSAQAEAGGWDAIVRPLITHAEVVRTSATVVTITLPVAAAYVVTANEVITATIPANAVTKATEITATSPLTITDDPALPVTAATSSGYSDARPGRSGAARRMIVDRDDPRIKFRLPY